MKKTLSRRVPVYVGTVTAATAFAWAEVEPFISMLWEHDHTYELHHNIDPHLFPDTGNLTATGGPMNFFE